jgi:hypothetical protein
MTESISWRISQAAKGIGARGDAFNVPHRVRRN